MEFLFALCRVYMNYKNSPTASFALRRVYSDRGVLEQVGVLE